MGSVITDRGGLLQTAQNMKNAIQSLEAAKLSIAQKYQSLGQEWRDKKYKDLGDVVQECNRAMNSILKTLLQGEKALLQLYGALQDYDETNFGNTSSGYTRHLSPSETSDRWKTTVACIDAEIANYKQALMDRGVPECKWLTDTLAKHRAAMLEQEGYNLDVASGNRQTSTNSSTAYSYPADYAAFYNELADEFRQHCLTHTNPNYNEAPQWRNNCQRCVPALEMRRRGAEVTARPSTYGSEHLSYYPFDVWQNATVLNCQGSGRSDIQRCMSEWGDGARAQVVVYWDGPHGGGHTFIAEQRNGETVFSDPQTGNRNAEGYFNRVISGRTQFCRIDNLEYSNYIEECYQEV